MFHVRSDVYFYGEFGCLNYAMLGHIEERQPRINISTQPDYFKLMKMKCDKISKAEDIGVYRANCKGAGFGLTINDPVIDSLENQGFVSLKDWFGFKESRCIEYLKPLKTPLEVDMGLKDEYVSISLRKRSHEPERNLSEEDWDKIIETIRGRSDLEIIAHGMEMDTINTDRWGIKRVGTIEESVAYMNKSKVFIASMSGIAQMASNCACGIIQIGDPKKHHDYDPFNKGAVAVVKEDLPHALSDFLK